jgi:ABC-type branched-subunit amino acid transport system ATPase component/branched-subunit amino acid ABC-type transport system permease component
LRLLEGDHSELELVFLVTSGSVVLGLINGILIGLLAVGIVLVYKSNRFLNLAHAQMGALSVQLLGKFVLDWGWSWWVAFVVCVPIGMVIGGLIDRYVVRPLRERSASTVALLLLSLGVSQILLVFTYVKSFGPSQAKEVAGYPQPFNASIHVGGVVLGGADVLIMILIPILVVALGLFLRYSFLGKTIRAAASNHDQARLCGISTRQVSLITWVMAGGLSAIAGILQAPSLPLFDSAALGPYLLLLGLGAAAVGAFVSLPLALVGGLLIGLVDQLVLAGTSSPDQAELAVLATIIAIVLARGSAIGKVFAAGGAVTDDLPPLRIPQAIKDSFVVRYQRKAPVVAAFGVALLLPLLPVLRAEGRRFDIALILVYGLVAMSLTVAMGWAGQVSLGQFALVGCGAFVAGHLIQAGWSLPILLLVCGAVSAAFMLVIGLPALRVPGLTLAVTTLGLAVVAPDWLFHQSWFGTTHVSGYDLNVPALIRGVGRPGSQLVVYYLSLAVVVLLAGALWALRRSGPGRLVVAVRDNEAAAATFGVTPATVKMAALSLSGFVAGTAGVLWADAWRTISPMQFTPDVSISILAVPVIGGIGSLAGAIGAAWIIYGFMFFVSPHLGGIFPSGYVQVAAVLMIGGLGLVGTLLRYPQGIAGAVRVWWQSRLDRSAETAIDLTGAVESPGLVVENVHLSFGGLRVLNGASIEVRPKEIVGLIGPNGAGKTTLLNVISGRLDSHEGRIVLGGVDLTGLDPEVRSAFGLARSFQDARLFPGLTVTETVQVASSNRYRVGLLSSMLSAPWASAAEVESRQDAESIIERLGLSDWSQTLTAQLSTGTRRVCDLAAQVAARPKVLLLDEPTAGIAQREAEAFGPLLRTIRDELDCSILIVEHDMPLLMALCDRIYAMELGEVIAAGTPAEVRSDPAVIASYLGTAETAIARSGNGTGRSRSRKAPAGN